MFHEFDVALSGLTVETAALSLSLIGHTWPNHCGYVSLATQALHVRLCSCITNSTKYFTRSIGLSRFNFVFSFGPHRKSFSKAGLFKQFPSQGRNRDSRGR